MEWHGEVLGICGVTGRPAAVTLAVTLDGTPPLAWVALRR